jgi:dolichol-phosphate mannosyltransferase
MVARWREGFEVVHAVRITRAGESWFKRATAAAFYQVLRKLTAIDIVANAGDFRLLDRRAADALKSLRERNRFVRGLSSWIGFRQAVVRFDRASRAAGETKYPLRKMLALATDAVVSFSDAPLYVSLAVGFAVSAMAFIAGIVYIVMKLMGVGGLVPGWATIVVILSFLGGMQILLTGMMGLYVARIHDEVKARPLYIVREMHGVGEASPRLAEGAPSVAVAAGTARSVVAPRRES